MIYLTGDCRGDFHRLSTKNFPDQKKLTKDDFVIILGDAGFLWDGSREEKYWLDFLENKPFTVLNVGGNHENFDRLKEYPEIPFHGGFARQIRPSVYELSRGCVFELCALNIFCMGGAQTHDVDLILPRAAMADARRKRQLRRRGLTFRIEGLNWWPDEMPDREDYRRANDALRRVNWDVYMVLTHCAPNFIQCRAAPDYPRNELTTFLDSVGSVHYRKWFCGHYHKSWRCDTERFQILYEEIIPIPESIEEAYTNEKE